jgi:hypothetical protein
MISARSRRIQLVKGLESLKKRNRPPHETLEYIDSFARMFMREKFEFSDETGYGDMNEFFAKKEKPQLALFCQKMIEARYSGKALTKDELSEIIMLFENILIDYEKSLRHEMSEAIRKIYIQKTNIPFVRSIAKAYFALKKIIAQKLAKKKAEESKKQEESKKEAPAQIAAPEKPIKREKQAKPAKPAEPVFIPEKITIKKYKAPKMPLASEYVGYIDILDRIDSKIKEINKQVKSSQAPAPSK